MKPTCPNCKSRDFYQLRSFDRPLFRCGNCAHKWTDGKTGGKYAKDCARRESSRKPHEPHYILEGEGA